MLEEHFQRRQRGKSAIADRRHSGGPRMASIETKGKMDELIAEHRRVTIRQMTAETVMMQRSVHEKAEYR
jgi:hypothetical protein